MFRRSLAFLEIVSTHNIQPRTAGLQEPCLTQRGPGTGCSSSEGRGGKHCCRFSPNSRFSPYILELNSSYQEPEAQVSFCMCSFASEKYSLQIFIQTIDFKAHKTLLALHCSGMLVHKFNPRNTMAYAYHDPFPCKIL